RIDEMPLTARVASLDMQWCLQCHRNASRHIRPLADVFTMNDTRPLSQQEIGQLNRLFHLQDTRRLTDCSTCHR
ncbi:cytochrome C, partial [Paraburkholderia sp. SIMBA_055]